MFSLAATVMCVETSRVTEISNTVIIFIMSSSGSYPHAELDVLPTVDLHAGIQQTDLTKVFPIDHEGAADHGRSSGGKKKYNSIKKNV